MKDLILNNDHLPRLDLNLTPKAQTVLDAATKIFLTHGFNGATTDMIQRAANVSKSTVYAHFSNKERLFLAVVQSECASFTQSMHSIKFTPGNLVESLRELGHAYLNVALSDSALALYRVVIAEAPRFPALGHMFYNSGPHVVKSNVIKCFQIALDAQEIDLQGDDINEVAEVFVAMLRSELHLQCLTHPDQPLQSKTVDHWVNIAINTFIRSYGAK
ncbi:TetR/AcrR family transcriptional regulator [Psychromonas sp. 14N.309.X.WAT.B.A12]|uniref:TetR/AcrR family transcriptional regulator n=1 Tax=unclassified Psychromonas TaxID=2614957 RepID=UPI0025B18312|nr:TetR/AcrR family transcriptional regulator [Psychromonas sp. 14N.309.X.WAT.B.A12]MDN2663458.1 TetR/AcrR family transcriptional regulator [Psychromonas sp. 14N.309.X.WAT.B.A12]